MSSYWPLSHDKAASALFQKGPVALGLCLLCGTLQAETSLDLESPFLPETTPGQTAAVEGEVQLSGMTVIGPTTFVCLTDTAKKKSRWIAVGTKEEGMEVLSASLERNEAIVLVNQDRRVLPLRKASTTKLAAPTVQPRPALQQSISVNPVVQPPMVVQANPGAATAAQQVPGQPAGPAKPEVGPAGGELPPVVPLASREEQEREARMLVSDLMEIGIRQRKAYEEARKKAEAEAAKKKASP